METTKKYANSDSPVEERMKQKDDETAAIQYYGKKNINIIRIGIDGDENNNKIKNINKPKIKNLFLELLHSHQKPRFTKKKKNLI